MIVTGIRLFNKECGKGGEGIDDCELNIYMYLIQNAFILSFENTPATHVYIFLS